MGDIGVNMKYLIINVLCVVFLSGCSIENNPFESFEVETTETKQTYGTEIVNTEFSDDEKADVRMEQIMLAIKNNNKELLMSLFSKKALNEAENFENRIDYLFDFLEGNINSWKIDKNEFESTANTGRDGDSIMIRFPIIINTDKDDYLIFVFDYHTDTINPDNEGIYMLQIMKLSDRNNDWGEWYERLCAGIYDPKSEVPQKTTDSETLAKTMLSIGKRIKQLSDVEGIDEPVIFINEFFVTKREYETEKILNDVRNLSLKEAIDSLIKTNIIKSETTRLGIVPSYEGINNYLESIKEDMESNVQGTETFFALMEGLGLTLDEFLIEQEKMAYDMFLMVALREHVEQMNKNYEKYIDELVKKADIRILDDEIFEAYNS